MLLKTVVPIAALQTLAADSFIVLPIGSVIDLGEALTADFFFSWAPDDVNTGYTHFIIEGSSKDSGDDEWYTAIYQSVVMPAAISINGSASVNSDTIADAAASSSRININEYAFFKEAASITDSEWVCIAKINANVSYQLYNKPSRNHIGPYYNKAVRLRRSANVEALKRLRLIVNTIGRACVFEVSAIKSEA